MSKTNTVKATQTLWLSHEPTKEPAFIDGGWVAPRYHWLAWTLSCLLLKQHFERVDLVTDEAGKRILIDCLELPYDGVDSAMEQHKKSASRSWVLAKLASVATHQEPFLHVDGDLFLWERPSEEFLTADLTAQHLEIGYPAYSLIINALKENTFRLPAYMEHVKQAIGINTGLLGGQNYSFFQRFLATVNDFYDRNNDLLQNIPNDPSIATVAEQVFFHYQALSEGLKIKTLIKPSFKGEHHHFSDFWNAGNPENPAALTHLLGTLRQSLFSCKLMEFHLRYLFPDYYERTDRWFDSLGFNPQNAHFELPFSIEKQRPPEEWTDTHVEAALQNTHRRSLALLNHWGIAVTEESFAELPQLRTQWNLSALQCQQLEDCLQYEHARKNQLKKAISEKELLRESEYRRFLFLKKWSSKSPEELNECIIAPGGEPFPTSRWNWHQRPPQLSPTPGQYSYDLVIDHHSLYLQEFTLSPVKTALLSQVQEPTKLYQVLQKIINNDQIPWGNKENKIIFDLLNELYLKGFISFL